MSRMLALKERLALMALAGRRDVVLYVTDWANWSFYWDAHYLTRGLRQAAGIKALTVRDPWRQRGRIIHFGDRYGFLNGPHQRLHPSNHLFLTWFHGDPADPNPAMRRLFELLLPAAPRLRRIVVTCAISRQVLRDQGLPDGQLVTIPLGVDLHRFAFADPAARARARAALGAPEKALCLGSFQKDGEGWGEGDQPKLVKGPDVFLEVIARLARRRRDLFVLLTGPARGYVKRGLEKIGVPFLHRQLDHYHQIAPYYQALDLYLVTSRAEGGPKALLESWACGAPVVSTRVGMCADLIEPGRDGQLAEVEDAEALAEAVLALGDDPQARREQGRAGRAKAEGLGWGEVARRYHDQLYRPILAGEGGA